MRQEHLPVRTGKTDRQTNRQIDKMKNTETKTKIDRKTGRQTFIWPKI